MVQRHHPDRSLRRCPHGRRRFRGARRRDQFRHRAGAGRGRAARRGRQPRRSHRLAAQEQPAAAGRRDQHPPPGHPGEHHHACGQPRARAGAPVRAGRRQPRAVGDRALRQYPAVQSAEDAGGSRKRPARAAAADDPGAEPDAEVSFVTRDLGPILPKAKIAAVLADGRGGDGGARRRQSGSAAPARCRADGSPASRWPMRRKASPNPYAGFETRIAPENITLLPKTTAQTTGGNPWNERTDHPEEGRLGRLGAARSRRQARRHQGRRRGARRRAAATAASRKGQKLRILLAPQRPQAAAAAAGRGRQRQRRRRHRGAVGPGQIRADRRAASTPRWRRRDGRRGRRRQRRAALPEHLRDRAAQPGAAPGDRRSHPHLFLRRRLPAQGPARRFVRDPVRRRGRKQQREGRRAVRLAHHRRRDQEILSLSSRPTTMSSTTTTRPARARRSSWCASRCRKES